MRLVTSTAIAALTAAATVMVPAASTFAAGPRIAPLTYGLCVAESVSTDSGSQGDQAPGQTGEGPFVALIDLQSGDAIKIIGPLKSHEFTGLIACGRSDPDQP
jgi:hypothetical protein